MENKKLKRQLDEVYKVLVELPYTVVNNSVRSAVIGLINSSKGARNKTVQATTVKDQLAEVIKILSALQQGLDTSTDVMHAKNRMRKALSLPYELAPFTDETFEDWRPVMTEIYPGASEVQLREWAEEAYIENAGIQPPGPMDYTR